MVSFTRPVIGKVIGAIEQVGFNSNAELISVDGEGKCSDREFPKKDRTCAGGRIRV